MRILFSSHLFYPSIGGVETISTVLASEFVKKGCQVILITQTPAKEEENFPFCVVRKPNAFQLVELVRWCDIFFHNNLSLQAAWPLLLFRKPWIVAHHTWISRPDGSLSWQDYLKRSLIKFATCISVSRAVADHISTPSVIIGNPYDDDLFQEIPGIHRDLELVFLGRLVSDKGADLLIEALAKLKYRGLTPKLTIIGSGPEEDCLRNLAAKLEIFDQIDFLGKKAGMELVQLLNRHQIMVVSSRWQEPFGIVALEGIACGCVVVGSEGGGLRDAIGPCGMTFPNGDVQALTQSLADLLTNPEKIAACRSQAATHLMNHKQSEVAKAYLQVIEGAIQ